MTASPRTRRALGLVAGTLAAVLALAGCASDAGGASAENAGSSGTGDQASALIPAAEGKTSYPLTLETAYGETTLTERPERIAVIGGLGDQESVIALRITPVVGSSDTALPWLEDTTFDGIEVFVNPWADSFNFEAVAAADPDLIVASTFGALEDDFDRLAAIAPVLAVPSTGDYAWDWEELIAGVGEATDLTAAAEEQIERTKQSVVDAKAAHPEFAGHTISVLINRGQEFGVEFVNRTDSPAEKLLTELGFDKHPNVAELSASADGNVSLENIGLVDADALVIARHGGDGTVEEATAWLEQNPLFSKLSAVQAGRVSYLDPNPENGSLDLAWAFAYPNVLADRWAVSELTAAFDGLYN